MNDLVTWLRQQFDADERQANNLDELDGWDRDAIRSTVGGQLLDYLDQFSPARVLAEVDAKRRILSCFISPTGEPTGSVAYGGATASAEYFVKLLALPYADRPGYREEWRP